MIDTVITALEQSPKALHSVRVNAAKNEFLLAVVDVEMKIMKKLTKKFIHQTGRGLSYSFMKSALLQASSNQSQYSKAVSERLEQIRATYGTLSAYLNDEKPIKREQRTTRMTTLEAYAVTMRTIAELQDLGVGVVMRSSFEADNAEIRAKYGPPDRLEPCLWISVLLYGNGHGWAIGQKLYELHDIGIRFCTTGYLAESRDDWELDWTFRVEETDEDSQKPCN